MELLETQDPEKKRLLETSDRHKHELEREVKNLSDKTERFAKNTLIIGGTLVISYLIVSTLSSSKKKKKKRTINKMASSSVDDSESEDIEDTFSPSSLLLQIGERFATQATALLLSIAKDKLMEYLSNRNQKDENS